MTSRPARRALAFGLRPPVPSRVTPLVHSFHRLPVPGPASAAPTESTVASAWPLSNKSFCGRNDGDLPGRHSCSPNLGLETGLAARNHGGTAADHANDRSSDPDRLASPSFPPDKPCFHLPAPRTKPYSPAPHSRRPRNPTDFEFKTFFDSGRVPPHPPAKIQSRFQPSCLVIAAPSTGRGEPLWSLLCLLYWPASSAFSPATGRLVQSDEIA